MTKKGKNKTSKNKSVKNKVDKSEDIVFKGCDLKSDIQNIINGLLAFDSRDKSNAIKYNKFLNNIENLYLYLTILLLSGDFRNDFNKIYKSLNGSLLKLKNSFEEEHEGDNKGSKLEQITKNLDLLITDIGVIYDINTIIDNKRKNILYIDGIGGGESREGYQKLFFITYMSVIYDVEIVNNHGSKRLARSILSNLKDLQKLELKNIGYTWIKEIVLEKLKYSLFKIAVISKKKYYEIYIEKEIEKIDLMDFKDSFFLPIVKQFQFIFRPETNSLGDIEGFLGCDEKYNDTTALLICIKHYKERLKDSNKLTKIYEEYKSNLNTKSSLEKHINYIFLGNNLLSLLIQEYKVSNDDDKIKKQIESLYKDITDKSKKHKNSYNNYFTYYKYSLFKLYEYKNKIHKKEFYKAKGVLIKGQSSLTKTLAMFESGDYHDYYEFNTNSNNILLTDGYNDKLEKIFCFNLYATPFDIEREEKNLSELQENYFKSNLDIDYKERFNDIEDKVNSYKSEAMTIIGIFTGIVVYSFGTIQLFSLIEDIGSAIMFSGIFLSGILFIIASIFFEGNTSIIKDKGSKIFLLGMCIIILSLCGKVIFSGTSINMNKGKNITEKLENEIQKAENTILQTEGIKEKIDEYIRIYNSTNKN